MIAGLIVLLLVINCGESSDLTQYINEQAEIVGEKLMGESRNLVKYEIKIQERNEFNLPVNYSYEFLFQFQNKLYILLDANVYKIKNESYQLVDTFQLDEKIKFVKSIEYNDFEMILIVTKLEQLFIFQFEYLTEKIIPIHEIHQTYNVSDALFFINDKNLYLIVANEGKINLAPTSLYQFRITYFDKIDTVLTSGQVKLFSFKENKSEMIIILQRVPSQKSFATLYEFNFNRLEKLHILDIKNPVDFLSFCAKNQSSLLVLNKINQTSVYYWTGAEFILSNKYPKVQGLNFRQIVYFDKNPFLISTLDNNLLINSLSNFDLVANVSLTSIKSLKVMNGTTVAVIGNETALTLTLSLMTVKINELKHDRIEEKLLSKCLVNLEESVYRIRNFLKTSKSREASNGLDTALESKRNFEKVKNRFETVQPKVRSYFNNPEVLVVKKVTVIKHPLQADKAIANNSDIKFLNSHQWLPENWLQYSNIQTISAPVKIKILKIKKLKTNDPMFKNLLTTTGNQILTGNVTVNSLEANQFMTEKINNIPIENIYYKSNPVMVKSTKRFMRLRAKSAKIRRINGMEGGEVGVMLTTPTMSKYDFNETLTVENLWIEEINDINFNEFKNSIFRYGIDSEINGNLHFTNLEAKQALFNELHHYKNVLTRSTDQIITAPVFVDKILTKDITATTVNGINFSTVATFNSTIEGPILIDSFHIRGDLSLKGEINESILLKDGTHIMGTNETDLLQLYNRKVVIKGDLILSELNIKDSAGIEVDHRDFNPKMVDFWTKSTNQQIPVHFEAMNGITTPHLRAILINNVDLNDFMLNSKEAKQGFTKFYFEDVKVNGDVVLNEEKRQFPNLRALHEDAVRISGDFDVRGRKFYSGDLKVDHLEVDHVDLTNKEQKPSANRQVMNLIVKGDLIGESIETKFLNGVNLEDLLQSSAFVDREADDLVFDNVTVDNLEVDRLQDENMDELIDKLINLKNYTTIKNLQVVGDLQLNNINNLTSINGLSIEDLVENSTTTFDNTTTVSGNVKFAKNVNIKDLYVKIINDEDFETLSNRLLYKHWNQIITKPYIFTNIKTDNLLTSHINNISVENLINVDETKKQEIFVSNGLKFTSSTKIKSLSGNLSCDLMNTISKIQNPEWHHINNVKVTGNVTFWNQESNLLNIIDHVVTKNANHAITGVVTFTENVTTTDATIKTINQVDLSDLFKDALLQQFPGEQFLTGKIVFDGPLQIDQLKALKELEVDRVNYLNISEIDEKIIQKYKIGDVHLRGKKKFVNGLQCNRLEVEAIDGINPFNLVTTTNTRTIPQAMMETIKVKNNLNVNLINFMPLDELLKNRVVKRGGKQIINGTYVFKDLTITGNVSTNQINDIKLENVVFDEKNKVQVIPSPKTFNGDVRFIGNVKSDYLNGIKLSETYEQAALIDEPTTFTKKIIILSPSRLSGNIKTNFINNIPVDYMRKTIKGESIQNDARKIDQLVQNMSQFLQTHYNSIIGLPSEFLYLEQSAKVQIALPKTLTADIIEQPTDVLIHIGGEEEGHFCGLPDSCPCPVQYTIQITDKHSISVFPNKGSQRVFTYYDDAVKIHFITNSISHNSNCRTSKSEVLNEVSTLTWHRTPSGNKTGGFFMNQDLFRGYISDVKFFTIDGTTYILIGTYYDPILDSHLNGCDIYKFNYDNTAVSQIQHLPAEGLRAMSVMYTVRGVILIIGKSSSKNDISTEIYRFDRDSDQFGLLRTVPAFGSLSAVGVVLASDNLIILANKHSTLHIMKYDETYDNYYFYQSFQLDDPIHVMSVFYSGDFGISDAYLSVVTTTHRFFVYSYQYIQGWTLESSGELDGLRGLIPFKLNQATYLFAPSAGRSSLLTFVKHDSD